MFRIQKIFHGILLLTFVASARAQEGSLSPEVAQMYRHAQAYMAKGNYKDARITLRQAIALQPNVALYKELGRAEYLSGNYEEADHVLSGLVKQAGADAESYYLLAAANRAAKNYKKARSALRSGLEHFPDSGLLHHETGQVHYLEGNHKAALNAWLDGVQRDRNYAPNYYDAAQTYLGSGRVLWGLLYGEIYLNIAPDTTGMYSLKKQMFAAYKTMFDGFGTKALSRNGNVTKAAAVKGFEGAVQNIYASLTPVVSDGITMENLTMVRTRFFMDWFAGNSKTYPFSLFTYLDGMIRTGYFDVYSEWLFGEVESAAQHSAWNAFHEGESDRFGMWRKEHPYSPAADPIYNDRDMHGLFKRKSR